MADNFKSVFDLIESFPDERSCVEYLEERRWGGNVVSPFDPTSKVYKYRNGKYRCKNTGKYFTVRTKSIFENSKVSLRKWMMAIYLMMSSKKGISSYQLARQLNITQKTAWFMLHRIRECYAVEITEPILDGDIEADETFVGGKNKNRKWAKKIRGNHGRSFKDKTPVLGMVQRDGLLVAKVVKNTSVESLTPIILETVKNTATLHTDEWEGYNAVRRIYNHHCVFHSAGQYVNGDVTTNRIEGFWSWLKRSIVGIYHSVSRKHLQRYVDELVWRYNVRANPTTQQFSLFFDHFDRRLTYKRLVYG